MENNNYTSVSSPLREKRTAQTVVTPNVDSQYKKKSKYEFKTTNDVVPKI